VFSQSLGDTFFYVTTEGRRLASLALDALFDVPVPSWLVIGVVALVTALLWSKRSGR
jgi:ribose/xylose/arabinose/galactoside ABC-type transport system permease subunit